MEQIFKVSIKNSEAAGVEIVPTEDGIELIITRRQQEKKVPAGSSNNLELLRDFCSQKKKEEGVDKKELKAFWDWYSERAEDWKGKLQADKLWTRWLKDK